MFFKSICIGFFGVINFSLLGFLENVWLIFEDVMLLDNFFEMFMGLFLVEGFYVKIVWYVNVVKVVCVFMNKWNVCVLKECMCDCGLVF